MLHPLTDPAVVKAMAHPLRVQLLTLLETDAKSPSDLAELLGEPLGKVSYHVRTLASLGLIELVDRQPRRGAVEHFYRLAKRWIIEADTWSELPSSVKRAVSRSITERICTELRQADASNAFDEPNAYLTRTPVVLDARAQRELTTRIDELLQRATQLERETLERRAGRGADDEGSTDGGAGTASRIMFIVTMHRDPGRP